MKRCLISCLGIWIVCVAVVILGCGSAQEESMGEQALPVRTVRVEKQWISHPIHTSGRLSSSAEMKLSFKVGGIVDKLYVDEGDHVQKHQVLASLKLDEIQAQTDLARSGYEKANSNHL